MTSSSLCQGRNLKHDKFITVSREKLDTRQVHHCVKGETLNMTSSSLCQGRNLEHDKFITVSREKLDTRQVHHCVKGET